MVYNLLRLAHVLGFAGVGIGLSKSYQTSDHRVSKETLWSVALQIVTGFLLITVEPEEVDHVKITYKLGIAIILGLFLWVKRTNLSKKQLQLAIFLYLANTIIAVLV